jgi:hypothetical protein
MLLTLSVVSDSRYRDEYYKLRLIFAGRGGELSRVSVRSHLAATQVCLSNMNLLSMIFTIVAGVQMRWRHSTRALE